MLGNIAKKLRLMGFDAKYLAERSDHMTELFESERTLITKDLELVNKAKKRGVKTIFVTGDDELAHFKEIKQKINVRNFLISAKHTRCTLCNGRLNSIEKSLVINKIPKNVSEKEDCFWQCVSCKKLYWQGTHISHLQNFVRMLNDV